MAIRSPPPYHLYSSVHILRIEMSSNSQSARSAIQPKFLANHPLSTFTDYTSFTRPILLLQPRINILNHINQTLNPSRINLSIDKEILIRNEPSYGQMRTRNNVSAPDLHSSRLHHLPYISSKMMVAVLVILRCPALRQGFATSRHKAQSQSLVIEAHTWLNQSRPMVECVVCNLLDTWSERSKDGINLGCCL